MCIRHLARNKDKIMLEIRKNGDIFEEVNWVDKSFLELDREKQTKKVLAILKGGEERGVKLDWSLQWFNYEILSVRETADGVMVNVKNKKLDNEGVYAKIQ